MSATIGEYHLLYEESPHEVSEAGGASQTYYTRSQTMVVAHSVVTRGAELAITTEPDEYFVWAINTSCRITTADGADVEVQAPAVAIVPPGSSVVTASDDGELWRGFTTRDAQVCAKCPNNADFVADQVTAAIEPWPMPADGYRVRVYRLDDYDGPRRCFRSRTAMTAFRWPARTKPRPAADLSPHFHDDFEQFSLIFAGTHVHHMRRAWGRDSSTWLPDEHMPVTAPALILSRPPDVHTTQALTNGEPAGLIDFFAPPRWDFSRQDGRVLNADEYPMPQDAGTTQ